MLHLGAVLGLRCGECAGLRVGRLDFFNRTLVVAEQLTRVRHGVIVGVGRGAECYTSQAGADRRSSRP
jgi:hypothetical protein